MHFAAPAGHDDVVIVTTRPREARALLEGDGCGEVVTGDDGEGAACFLPVDWL
jgi:hypothetical protein